MRADTAAAVAPVLPPSPDPTQTLAKLSMSSHRVMVRLFQIVQTNWAIRRYLGEMNGNCGKSNFPKLYIPVQMAPAVS
jgi:hypothetical protein